MLSEENKRILEKAMGKPFKIASLGVLLCIIAYVFYIIFLVKDDASDTLNALGTGFETGGLLLWGICLIVAGVKINKTPYADLINPLLAASVIIAWAFIVLSNSLWGPEEYEYDKFMSYFWAILQLAPIFILSQLYAGKNEDDERFFSNSRIGLEIILYLMVVLFIIVFFVSYFYDKVTLAVIIKFESNPVGKAILWVIDHVDTIGIIVFSATIFGFFMCFIDLLSKKSMIESVEAEEDELDEKKMTQEAVRRYREELEEKE